MHKLHPKTVRRHKRIFMGEETQGHISDVRVTTYPMGKGSRVNKLPRSYDKYNPNKVHIARRRKAVKEFNMFPRGWTMQIEHGPVIIDPSVIKQIASGGWTTVTKLSENNWTINGSVYA